MNLSNLVRSILNLLTETIKQLYLYLTYFMIFVIFLLMTLAGPIFISRMPEATFLMGVFLFFYPHFISFFVSEKKVITDADQVEAEVERDTFSLSDNILGMSSLLIYLIVAGIISLSGANVMLLNGITGGGIVLLITILKLAKKF